MTFQRTRLAILVILATSCTHHQTAGPQPSAPSQTASPSGPSTPGQGKFTKGSAHVEMTGELTATFDMAIKPDTTQWNPQGMSLFFRDSKGDEVGLGGTSKVGKRSTSQLMTFTVTDVTAGYLLGISVKGECTIVVTRSDTNGVDANVDCQHWKIENKRLVNVRAVISAST